MRRNEEALSFLPKSIIKLLAERTREYALAEGTVLFADVAGFTPLTEALLVLGKEGSEELTRILNHHFSSMIEITESRGGDVLRFAGDAMTVFFPEDDGRKAISCGLAMLEKIKDYAVVESRAGKFELAMKIGCAFGEIQIGLLGPMGEMDYYAFGEPLDLSAEAEHHARKGDIVSSGGVYIPEHFEKEDKGEGFSLITGTPELPFGVVEDSCSCEDLEIETMLPPHILEKAHPGVSGEHRGTTVIFLSFELKRTAPERSHIELSRIYSEALSIVKKYGGVFNKVDFGDKGAKAVILFGAPLTCENKEEMAVRTGMDLMRSLGEPCRIRMGITTSHLFSGPLGSARRREFTVMGDGINLSARLMAYSKCGEIITDEETYRKSKESVAFDVRGEISVKGKSGLIKIFEPRAIKEEKRDREIRKLYGRKTVQDEIKEWLLSGTYGPAAVLGDAGSGKSALADWLYREASAREFHVFKADLQPFSKEIFFSVFSRLLRKGFGVQSKEDIGKVTHLLPALSREFFTLLYPYFGFDEEKNRTLEKLGPKDRRDIAYSMLLSLFQSIEETVLIIDNLSFADEASLDFLLYLMLNSQKRSLALMAFSRRDVSEYNVFKIFKKTIDLSPLEKDHIFELITEEFKIRGCSDSFTNFLLEKSKGSPQLLLALMTSIKSEGLLFEKDGFCFIDEDRLFKTPFPDSLEAIYLKEFDKLNMKEKQLLFEASVLGTNVSVNLLGQLSSLGEAEIGGLVGILADKGFIRPDNSGKRPYFVFSDTLLYEAVYNLAPFSVKRNLHKEVFLSLMQMEGDAKPALFPYLAYHSEKADDKESALKFHRLSGRNFLEKFDNVSALRHLDYVMKNDSPSPGFFEDAFSLFDIYLSLGKFTEAKQLLDILRNYKGLMEARDISSLYNFESEKNIREGDVKTAEENLSRSLESAEKSNDLYAIARALINLVGRVYGPTGRYDEGKAALERILSLQQFEKDTVFRVVALMNLGSILRHQSDFNSASAYYKQSLRFARKGKLLPRQTAIINNLIELAYESGELRKAVSYSKKGIELANNFSQRELYLGISIMFALSLWAKGLTRDAIQISVETKHKAELFDKPYSQAMSSVVIGVSQFEELFLKDALENIINSVHLFESISCGFERLSSILEYLRLLRFLGDDEGFDSAISHWGGEQSLLESATSLSLPPSLISVLGKNQSEPAEDPDTAFICWLKDRKKDLLIKWRKDLIAKDKLLRYDLKVKWAWAFLYKGLEPPFNPMRLFSKSKGGVFGLRILALLFEAAVKGGNRPLAKRLRRKIIPLLYFVKSNSDEKTWNLLMSEKEIRNALVGN
jgi:class 3 adenylate cyclase/predicted ATPase